MSNLFAAANVPAIVRSAADDDKLNGSTIAWNPIEILQRARAANEDGSSSLQSFVCNEQMNRFRGKLDGKSAHPLDTVTAKLSFERGTEQYRCPPEQPN